MSSSSLGHLACGVLTMALLAVSRPTFASVYSTAVLADNPLAFYQFEDGSSTAGNNAADSSGNNKTATYNGSTGLAAGIVGNAATFNGTDAFVRRAAGD